MSLTGQARCVGEAGSAAVFVATFAMPPDSRYTRHTHDDHQLAWAASGVLTVVTDAGTWVLPSSRALWIPAGVGHETIADGSTTMKSLYLRPRGCAVTWARSQPVAVSPLLAELINYLATVTLHRRRRARAEAVLFDLLEPVRTATIEVSMPRDPRARDVARTLIDNPADPRSLDDWGRLVGASARTLARSFRADTGLGFDRWRTLTRLPCRTTRTRRRHPRHQRRPTRRLPDHQRLCRRVPPRDRPDPRRLLPPTARVATRGRGEHQHARHDLPGHRRDQRRR